MPRVAVSENINLDILVLALKSSAIDFYLEFKQTDYLSTRKK